MQIATTPLLGMGASMGALEDPRSMHSRAIQCNLSVAWAPEGVCAYNQNVIAKLAIQVLELKYCGLCVLGNMGKKEIY